MFLLLQSDVGVASSYFSQLIYARISGYTENFMLQFFRFIDKKYDGILINAKSSVSCILGPLLAGLWLSVLSNFSFCSLLLQCFSFLSFFRSFLQIFSNFLPADKLCLLVKIINQKNSRCIPHQKNSKLIKINTIKT